MPLLKTSDYQSPRVLYNRHLQTIYPALFRKVQLAPYERQRLETSDGDFIDLDWLRHGHSHLVIISHGLEGNSTRAYVAGMARIFSQHHFDVLAWNYRGCSGEPNRKAYSYHSGATHDLEAVMEAALKKGYEKISLVGFSLGGNLTLKYLGEQETHKPSELASAVAFSVPLDLHDCAIQIHKPSNFLYERRFLKSFAVKAREKAALFAEVDPHLMKRVRSVFDFDEHFTAPINGFQSAVDYYNQCSSMQFIKGIEIPTLVVNALNDPFLGSKCFESSAFEKTSHVTFERPASGGHVGFARFKQGSAYWSDQRALQWVQLQG